MKFCIQGNPLAYTGNFFSHYRYLQFISFSGFQKFRKMESAKCRLLLSENLQLDRCRNCKISSLGYRFIGGELVLLHSASDCSNAEKSVGITNFLSLYQCIKMDFMI